MMAPNQHSRSKAYSAVISGLEIWCSRDCFGRISGLFLSESDAVAASDFYSAQITVTQGDEPNTGRWIFQAVYVVAYPNGTVVTQQRFTAVDPRTEEIIEQVYETLQELTFQLVGPPAP